MRISFEGKVSIWLALVATAGGGALVVAPAPLNAEIGWSLISIACVGGLMLLFHQACEWQKLQWKDNRAKMIYLAGIIICGAGFVVFNVLYITTRVAVTSNDPNRISDVPAGSFSFDGFQMRVLNRHEDKVELWIACLLRNDNDFTIQYNIAELAGVIGPSASPTNGPQGEAANGYVSPHQTTLIAPESFTNTDISKFPINGAMGYNIKYGKVGGSLDRETVRMLTFRIDSADVSSIIAHTAKALEK